MQAWILLRTFCFPWGFYNTHYTVNSKKICILMFLLSIHVTSLTLFFHLSEPVNKMYIMWLQLSIWQGMYSNSFLQSLFVFHLLFCTNSNCIFFPWWKSVFVWQSNVIILSSWYRWGIQCWGGKSWKRAEWKPTSLYNYLSHFCL